LIASALPGEGKSTVASNLAVALTRGGKKVTLVDADFRHPSQQQLFGLKNRKGLFNIQSDTAERWDALAQATSQEGLHVVTAGPSPNDPAAVLESHEFAKFIEQFKTHSDWVLIDTPATLGLEDALVAARVADAILFVVESGAVPRRDALRAKALLASTGVPIVGVILNRATDVPVAFTYRYDATLPQTAEANGNGHQGAHASQVPSMSWLNVRERLTALIGPRRGA
jgi:capsular exopolysaccharide synthesis family protein